MKKDTVTVVDSASGRQIELPIKHPTQGPSVVDIGSFYRELGYFTYDPGFLATASCQSAITYIDGEQGILQYRGYPIEQLAAQSSFLEVTYMMLNGELPNTAQLDEFSGIINHHSMLNESLKSFFRGFYHD
ncbi:Citrate synthase (si), partial [hydrothermal vent metagenome]